MPDNELLPPAILQVIPSLDAGGAERTTLDMAKAIRKAGFRSVVASSGGRMESDLKQANATLIRMKMDSKNPVTIIFNAWRLAKLIREWNVALIHARSRAPAWSAWIAARKTHIPFVTTYHGIYNAQNVLKRLYNSVMARSDTVIANSAWTGQHIDETYGFAPKRLVVIPRGVDLNIFDPTDVNLDRVRQFRHDWAATRDNDHILLLPGRLTRWKGHLVFLEALSILKRRGFDLSHVRAVMIGDPQGRESYVDEVETAITDKGLRGIAILRPHVDDMPAAYLAADVVISASTDPEAFGRVAAEASAMARPVIATNHGGSRETVLPGETGYLTAPGSAAALAAAIEDMLKLSPDERMAMGERGKAYVHDLFTVDRMCADTIAVYRDLLAKAS